MVRSKKLVLVLSLMLLLGLVLAACGGGEESTTQPETNTPEDSNEEAPPADESDAEESDDVTKGGDLILLELSDAQSLDPHKSNDMSSANVQHNIYEPLVAFDQDGVLQPLLATSWQMIDDTTWEFKLREGVKFHDGSDFNAEVVKANLDRVLDPEVASSRLFLYEMITNVEVVDEYTVHITTEYPFAPLPAHLSHTGGGMISLEAIKKDYELMEQGKQPGSYLLNNPVGTGYFKFDHWEPGDYVRLVRNDDYWGEPALLDSVTFKVVSESLARLSELETGYAHINTKVDPEHMGRVENHADTYLNRQNSTSMSYVGFNVEKEPFNDVRVRQAISMAINKDEIIAGIYEGTGIPAVGPIAPGLFGYDPSVTAFEYDLEKAKELLAEAGYADGFKTTIWTNDNQTRIKVAEYLQQTLKELNIELEIEILEWGAYLDSTAAGNHDMFILGWVTSTGDADYATYPLFHSSNVGEAGNRSFLKDAELDELLDKARQESDINVRLDLYKQVQEKLVDLAPMLYLVYSEYLIGVRNEVHGFWQDTSGIYQLKDVWIEQTE